MAKVKVLVPSGALGIGFDQNALAAGIACRPDIIAIDGGSTDSGPHYLGTGTSKYARASVKSEWAKLMAARAEAGVPLLIGTAGTSGADLAVDWLLEITTEIANERGETLRVAVLKSGQAGADMAAALAAGRIVPLMPEQPISGEILTDCTNIVALAGAEQIAAALATGADIVIAGRATDTAVIAALPLARGCNAGAAWHGAKIAECGAFATTHPGSGTVLVTFDQDSFTLEPMGKDAAATPRTVSAHMLYENADPFLLHEPGGHLDVRRAKYAALDPRRVRVTGSKWVPSEAYRVKLEGARIEGYQTVSLVLIRDARYVENVEAWCALIEADAAKMITERGLGGVTVELRVMGRNATLGALETKPPTATELGILAIVTAPDQATASEVAKLLNPGLLHMPLTPDEPVPTFAFPFSPAEIERGPIYGFCLNHVLTLEEPMEAFRLDVVEVGA